MVRRRWVPWAAVWAVLSAAAFLLFHPLLAALLAIVGITLVAVVALAGDWDRHPGYEEREMARARRRAAKRERTKAARERDRALWAAQQARKGSTEPS